MDTATEERVVETTEELVEDLTFLAEKQPLSKEAFTSERTQNYAVDPATAGEARTFPVCFSQTID